MFERYVEDRPAKVDVPEVAVTVPALMFVANRFVPVAFVNNRSVMVNGFSTVRLVKVAFVPRKLVEEARVL